MRNSILSLLFISTLTSGIIISCSSNVDELRGKRGLSSADAYWDDGDDLVLPGKTTGTFLTMNCKWAKREGYKTNKIACRFEGEGGVKSYSKSLDLDAYYGDTVISEKVEMLPQTDFWNAMITIDKKYTSNVDVAYFLDGKEQDRQSVDFLLLSNKGIKSVREVDKTLKLDKAFFDAIGLSVGSGDGGGIGGIIGGVADALLSTIEIPLPERKAYPEILCRSNGDNLMINDMAISINPELAALPPESTRYYWDPKRFYKTILSSAGLPGTLGSSSGTEAIANGLSRTICDELTSGGSELLKDKCKAVQETQLSEPILNSKGFCLKGITFKDDEQIKTDNYCEVAIFDKKDKSSDKLYYMGLGRDRISEIKSDLQANSIEEAIKMYIESFDKCDDFAYAN